MEKQWTDQPDEVEKAEPIGSFIAEVGIVEVRKTPEGSYYISGGNLFGSQTVRCKDAEVALHVLVISCARKKNKPVPMDQMPSGAQLLENCEKKEES